MKDGNDFAKTAVIMPSQRKADCDSLHPAWRSFLRYCLELGHGEIERLKIQDGLPVIAEVIKQKVKFNA